MTSSVSIEKTFPATAIEEMDPVDVVWYRLDEATNPMYINSFLELDGKLDRGLFAKKLLDFVNVDSPNMGKRVEINDNKVVYAPTEYDENYHIVEMATKYSADDTTKLMSDTFCYEIDEAKPLWRVFIASNEDESKTFLVVKVSHCYGDGQAFVNALQFIIDDLPFDSNLLKLLHGANTFSFFDRIKMLLVRFGMYFYSYFRLMFMKDSPKINFRKDIGTNKLFYISKPVDITSVKSVAKSYNSTVNDVLLAAISKALGTYFNGVDVLGDKRHLRAIIPQNIRTTKNNRNLGNVFGVVYVNLAVGSEQQKELVEKTKHNTRVLKNDIEANIAHTTFRFVGRMSSQLQNWYFDIWKKKAVLVISNVKGPNKEVSICGCKLSNMFFWVPSSGDMRMGISIYSYAGKVYVGVQCDESVDAAENKVADLIQAELDHFFCREGHNTAVKVGADRKVA